MNYSKEEVFKLADGGVNMIVDASGMTKEDMLRIAKAVFQTDGGVIFKNINGLTVQDLMDISKEAGEAVQMDLT